MSRQNITEKIWYDPEVKSYIMLDVTDEIVPPQPLMIDNTKLLPKDEYHCTLVPAGKLSDSPEKVARVINEVTDYLHFSPNAVRFIGLGDNYYFCKDGDEATLVAEAMIVGLVGLRKIVQQTIPDYKPAFPHITLLKNEQSLYGIGIHSAEDLKKLCKKVDLHAT